MKNDMRHVFYFLLKLFHVNFDKFSFILLSNIPRWANQVVQVVKNPLADAGDLRDMGSIPGSGRSLGGGNDSPL